MKLRQLRKTHRNFYLERWVTNSNSECFICLDTKRCLRRNKLTHLNDCQNCKPVNIMAHQSCIQRWIETCLQNIEKEGQVTCPHCNCNLFC